jgi:hypothetical protein
MRSLKPFAPVAVVGMVAFALLVPIADAAASSPSSAVKASKAASCKKAKRKGAGRSATRTSADTARTNKRKCKKVVLRRTYRGKTSQGEPIVIKTNNLRKNVYELGTYVKHACNTYNGKMTFSEQFEMLFPVALHGTAFSAPLPSFDAQFLYKGTVTGHAGASTAKGQGNIPAGGEGDETCEAATFSFSIPKVREVRGIRPGR